MALSRMQDTRLTKIYTEDAKPLLDHTAGSSSQAEEGDTLISESTICHNTSYFVKIY